MITREETQVKFREYHDAQGLHDEVYTDESKINEGGGSNGHKPPFPEWWDDLSPAVQKTPR